MRKFGLIGNPIRHSWSKQFFDDIFSGENIEDCEYLEFQMESVERLRDIIQGEPFLEGLNITIPFKISVMDVLDVIDPGAGQTGAVNCIKIIRDYGRLILKGYNTDMPAFKSTLTRFDNISGKKAMVLGTGGASRAVCQALRELHVPYVLVSVRGDKGTMRYADIDREKMQECHLIINATPAGMWPDIEKSPDLPYEYLTQDHSLYDLVYNPEMTCFLKEGKKAGARIKNGLEMLYLQAVMSWKIWNNVE